MTATTIISGREYIKTIQKDENTFCPNCGLKEVYIEFGEGDYYEGPSSYCKSCSAEFKLLSCYVNPTLLFSNQEK